MAIKRKRQQPPERTSGQRELPIGQTDSFDGVVAVVHFVTGFKDDAEPPAAKALHRLEVRQVPGGRTRDTLVDNWCDQAGNLTEGRNHCPQGGLLSSKM